MSEERFNIIDGRFDRLEARMDGFQAGLDEVKIDVACLKTDVAGLRTDVTGLQTEVKDLRRHMGVLHEEALDRIQGIREDDSLRREMRAGFAELRQLILDHAVPGEAAHRHFSSTLADHEGRIRTLEGR